MGRFFNDDEDEINEYGESYSNGKIILVNGENDDSKKNKERYINSKLIEMGLYEGEEKVLLKDYSSKDLVKINGEFFLKKKELSKEDELFFRLKTIDSLKKNQEKQEGYLRIIVYILIFFTAFIVLSTVISIFIGMKSVQNVSKHLVLYSYEQNMEVEKDL